LDYPYGMTPLRKTYRFDPIIKGVEPENISNIIGLEAPLWTEFVRDQARIDYQTFPRLSAVAELAWSDPGEKDYTDFKNRLVTFNQLLDYYQVGYAPLNVVDPNWLQSIWQILGHFSNLFK
jgi:hexosaminidase